TNNRTLSVVNRGGGAGTGSTVIATVTLNSGTNLVDNVPTALTLSSVSGALTIASGDVLEFTSVHNGTGVADPGGLVAVAPSWSLPLPSPPGAGGGHPPTGDHLG